MPSSPTASSPSTILSPEGVSLYSLGLKEQRLVHSPDESNSIALT